MNVLAIDIGGTHVKILATGQDETRKFISGNTLTPKRMVAGVKKLARDWKYDVISMGYPGVVCQNRPLTEPQNLGRGWVGFDFQASFERPVKVVNDAAMQALGSYKGGKMLFLGLGTGLGSTMVVDGHRWCRRADGTGPSSLQERDLRGYVGKRSLAKRGKMKWRRHVADVVECLITALEPDDVILGGGNVKELKELPKGSREGDNANAFLGGFRLWGESRPSANHSSRERPQEKEAKDQQKVLNYKSGAQT